MHMHRLSKVDHPNLVTFLGIYFDNESSNIPVLLMELLPMSLSKFLEDTKDISNHTKYSISFGISLGLQYLHSQTPPIVHRDLTCKNVLLTDNKIAKIADLGVARIIDPDPASQYTRMTTAPGNMCHMPPESLALSEGSYDESQDNFDKLDVFSFGNILIHIFTQKLPMPKAPFKEGNIPRNEQEWRQHLLAQMTCSENLQKLAFQCLDSNQEKRPKTNALVEFFKHTLVTPAVNAMFRDKIEALHATVQRFTSMLQQISTAEALIVLQEKLIEQLLNAKDDHSGNIVPSILKNFNIMQEHTLDDSSLRNHLENSRYAKILTSLINWTQKEIETLQTMIDTIKDIGMYNENISYFIHNFLYTL